MNNQIAQLKHALRGHALYSRIRSVDALRLFMENHCLCVWDFMSLVKSLQQELTCVDTPWLPVADTEAARLINEIVLDEETDTCPDGKYRSHFQMYLKAMEEVGCNTEPIRRFLSLIRDNASIEKALKESSLPEEACAFTQNTFVFLKAPLPIRAAVFFHGREDLIPQMFTQLLAELNSEGLKCNTFFHYLKIHAETDAERHGPMAQRLLLRLFKDNASQRVEAEKAAIQALTFRLKLWDALLSRIEGESPPAKPRRTISIPGGGEDKIKSYSDLKGDGGSNVVAQVLAAKAQIKANLSQIQHRIAIASGKGGVGKSTLTWQLALGLKKEGYRVSCLDADLNGPSLAKLAGLENGILIPGKKGLVVPKTRSGIGVVSLGSAVPETKAVEFGSVAAGESHVWRATKEFTTLAQFLGSTDWGTLDFLLIDLPPGAERVFQFAEFLGEETSFILVTIPSEVSYGVVQRSLAALRKANANILGWIENMSGYYCEGCGEVRPLFLNQGEGKFDIPCLGKIPFDPSLKKGIQEITKQILKSLERKAA